MTASFVVWVVVTLYVGGVLVWFGLWRWVGDSTWWMALSTPFAPLFFMPLPLLWIAWMVAPSVWGALALVIATLIFVILFGRNFWPKPAPVLVPPEDSTISVLTFNVWWESKKPTTIQDSLEESPDVIALQELQPHMLSYIPHDCYPHQVVDSSGIHSLRLGIFSRDPLEAIDVDHLRTPDYRILLVRVHRQDTPFLLYNVHPRATNIFVKRRRENGKQRLGERIRGDFEKRQLATQALVDDVERRSEPTILVGDWNSTDLSDVYHLLARHFADAHVSSGRGFGFTFPAHTADLANLPIPWPFMRLDMIFCTEHLLATRCRVLPQRGESDHRPVLATFRFSNRG